MYTHTYTKETIVVISFTGIRCPRKNQESLIQQLVVLVSGNRVNAKTLSISRIKYG